MLIAALYGNLEVLLGIEQLLNSFAEVENVFVFDSFQSVRDFLNRYDVDLIFIDADDSITDWRYLVQKFEEVNHKTKIVLLSSNADQSVRAYEAGVFDYLMKPVKKRQLTRVLQKALR